MTTKRSIETRLEELEAARSTDEERLEWVDGPGLWYATEPLLSEQFARQGFVVERKPAPDAGDQAVVLEPKPSAMDISNQLQWHFEGPTAPFDAVRIDWADGAADRIAATADHPVMVGEPERPAEPVCVASGEGWRAMVPSGGL